MRLRFFWGAPCKVLKHCQPVVKVGALFSYGFNSDGLGNCFAHGDFAVPLFQCLNSLGWRIIWIIIYFFRAIERFNYFLQLHYINFGYFCKHMNIAEKHRFKFVHFDIRNKSVFCIKVGKGFHNLYARCFLKDLGFSDGSKEASIS